MPLWEGRSSKSTSRESQFAIEIRPQAAVIAFESRSSKVHSFMTGTNLPLHSRRRTSTFRSHQEPSLSSAIEKNVACSRPRQDDGENELVQPGFVLPLAWDEKLVPHQAVGQGAPQTIIRRSLPQCYKLVNAGVLVGTREHPPPPPPANISSPTSRLQLSHKHPRMPSR